MGYPKKHRGRRKMGSKKEELEKKIKRNKNSQNGQYSSKVRSIIPLDSLLFALCPFLLKCMFNTYNPILNLLENKEMFYL